MAYILQHVLLFFSTVGKFWPVSNFTQLHALTLAACSYVPCYIHTVTSKAKANCTLASSLGTSWRLIMHTHHTYRIPHASLTLYVRANVWAWELQTTAQFLQNISCPKQIIVLYTCTKTVGLACYIGFWGLHIPVSVLARNCKPSGAKV